MADEIHVTEVGGREATLPRDGATATMSDDPDVAREQIEQTRARMSETIDEIEDVLVRKKHEIQDRFDVVGRIREQPMRALGIALGAGLVLGFLTGGGEDDEEDRAEIGGGGHYRTGNDRAEMWEHRARRLLSIAREQESEIERLSRGREGHARDSSLRGMTEEVEERASMLGRTAEKAAEHFYDLVSSYVEGMVRRLAGN
ncbi:MAG TPA: DUF3618 domain-containing protein [Longimicrobiaceae bacterium]|nr:DUF3618 domain-containing protein [Longimicrobiaceae bacterium]